MEKIISKLLENKYENLVQFNVVNTTPNPISVSLFNTSQSLSNVPTTLTYINQPNTVFNSFGTPVGLTFFQDLATNTNTGEVYASFTSTYIQRYNSSGVLISTLNISLAVMACISSPLIKADFKDFTLPISAKRRSSICE
jgi:hypothetical protein